MPRSKSLAHYPSRYREYIEKVAVQGAVVRIPCDPLTDDLGRTIPARMVAAKLRGHFYAYLGALRREARAASSKRQENQTHGDLDIIEASAQSHMVVVTIEEAEGRVYVLMANRETSWQAKALAQATITEGSSKPTDSGLEDIAARLARAQSDADRGKP